MSALADLDFLHDEFGFRIVHGEGDAKDERSLVVLESDRARIKIELERGIRVVYFGGLDAPLSWAEKVDGKTVWFVDNALLNFIEHKSGAARSTASPAARLHPHVAEIVRAFADHPEDWWRAYEAYRAERLEQMRLRR